MMNPLRIPIRILSSSYIKKFIQAVTAIVEDLPLLEAGVSEDKLPFVKLENGTILYSHPPETYLRWAYRLLTPLWYRKIVPEEAFGAAWDAWFRYWSKGIMNQQCYYQLRPGDVAVEAGAYTGHYVIKMAQAVGQEGQIVAVEVQEDNLKILRKNVEVNNIWNVRVVPVGIWDSQRSLTFYETTRQKNSIVPSVLGNRKAKSYTVRVDTLDSILQNFGIHKVSFVVITVNGAEIEALRGMPNTLARGCHLTIAARYKREGRATYKTVVRMLEERGYAVVLHHKGFFFGDDNSECQAVVYALPSNYKIERKE